MARTAGLGCQDFSQVISLSFVGVFVFKDKNVLIGGAT